MGVLLSVIVFFSMQSWENKRLETSFMQLGKTYTEILKGSLKRPFGTMRSLSALQSSRCDVEQKGYAEFMEEFSNFASCSLSCHNETKMLSWIPRIKKKDVQKYTELAQRDGFPNFKITEKSSDGSIIIAKERDEYFPIYNVEPFENNKSFFGYDLSSNPVYLSAMEISKKSGRIAATSRLEIYDPELKENIYAFMLFLPIYRGGAHLKTLEEKHNYLQGYVAGFFVINDLLKNSFREIDLKGLDIHIDDVTDDNNIVFLFKSRDGKHNNHPLNSPYSLDNQADFEETIDVGGRIWNFRIHPSPTYFSEKRSSLALNLLIIVLVFTSIMIIHLFITVGQTSYVEKLVSERTQELVEMNSRLEQEIIEHESTTTALKDSEDNYRNIYNNAQVGLFRAKQSDGKIINANTRFAQMFGYRSQQEIIYDFYLFDQCLSHEKCSEVMKELKEKGEVLNVEMPLLRKDESHAWMRLWLHSYPERGVFEGVATDITDEKMMREANTELQAQLLQSQKLESIGRLAGGVAHDFNNMLTGILGYSELALMEVEKEGPLWKKLKVIESSGLKAASLTRQLLAFSRKQMLDMKTIDPNLVLQSIIALLRRIIRDDIELKCIENKGVWNIKADATQVEQILMNLSVNAQDAMPDGGYLTIALENSQLTEDDIGAYAEVTPGKYVKISVTDTGVGIKPEIQSKIFEPFFTTKELGRGTGLGLSTVFGIVKQHNGHIMLYSALDEGTTFNVYLPAELDTKTFHAPEEILELQPGNETILVVDDEPSILELIADTLKPLGYNIIVANNADTAFTKSHKCKGKIDLLIADVVMKGLNGKKLADSLLKKRPDIKVLLVSGYSGDIITKKGKLGKGISFIQKPLKPAELTRKIRDILDNS